MNKNQKSTKRILSPLLAYLLRNYKEKEKGGEYKCQKNMKRANLTNVPCVEQNLIHNNSSSSI